MILAFCFTLIFIAAYYTYNYGKSTTDSKTGKYKIDSRVKMSDEEFADRHGANKYWQQKAAEKSQTPNKGGLFRWKRRPADNESDGTSQGSSKRQKYTVTSEPKPKLETIDLLSDDSSDDDSGRVTVFDTTSDSAPIVIEDGPDTKPVDVFDSPPTFEIPDDVPEVKPKYSLNNLSISPVVEPRTPSTSAGPQRPMSIRYIAGVSVEFPVEPYRSQIAVTNAIIKGCKNAEHCLLESPTGSGKTLALLCGALAWQDHYKRNLMNESMKPKEPQLPGKSECSEDYEYGTFDPMLFEEDKKKENIIPKIFYGSRTHKQIEQVIREFKKTIYAHKRMTILSSREHTCIKPTNEKISKTQLCNNLLDPKNKSSCEYYKNLKKGCGFVDMESPWDIEDLVQHGHKREICPYFGARSMMESAEIIFCPYNYLIDPVIRSSMQIDLRGHIIIIDEAHNIENICRDVGSTNFREDEINQAMEDCNFIAKENASYQMISSYLNGLLALIQEQPLAESQVNPNDEATSACWTGEEAWALFEINRLSGERYRQFCSSCEMAFKTYNDVKESIREQNEMPEDEEKTKKKKVQSAITFVTKRLLEELLMALKCIQDDVYKHDYRVTIIKAFHEDVKVKFQENTWIPTKQEGSHLRTLKFMCMNSAMIFSQVSRPSRTMILASGTLSPVATFEGELGTKFTHKLHTDHVIPKEQVYVRVVPSGPNGTELKATYNVVQTLSFKDDLGQLILEVCQSVPHGVLVFFSSYRVMSTLISRWQLTGVYKQIGRLKHVFQEPRSSTQLDEVMNDYRSVIRHTASEPDCTGATGALLLGVFRGKMAEGIDFSDEEARCVLTIGIPYAVQTDPNVKLKQEWNDKNRHKGLMSGSEWYNIQAYRALNQALGRCIRHKNDWGAVLLVDQRFLSTSRDKYLPKWILNMMQSRANYNLRSELKEFVRRQEIREKNSKSANV